MNTGEWIEFGELLNQLDEADWEVTIHRFVHRHEGAQRLHSWSVLLWDTTTKKKNGARHTNGVGFGITPIEALREAMVRAKFADLVRTR